MTLHDLINDIDRQAYESIRAATSVGAQDSAMSGIMRIVNVANTIDGNIRQWMGEVIR